MRACVHRLFGANKNCSQDVNTHRLIKSAPRLPTNVKARAPVATLTYRYHWLHWLQLTPVTSHFYIPRATVDPFDITFSSLALIDPSDITCLTPITLYGDDEVENRDEDNRPCIFTWLLTDVSRRRSLQVQMGLYA